MKQLPQDLQVIAIELNSEPGVLLHSGDRVEQTLTVRIKNGQIAELYAIRNPDKLVGVGEASALAEAYRR